MPAAVCIAFMLYLHSIYIVLGITRNLEMTLNVWKDIRVTCRVLDHFSKALEHLWILISVRVLESSPHRSLRVTVHSVLSTENNYTCYSDTLYFLIYLCKACVRLKAHVLLTDIPKNLLDNCWFIQSFPLDLGFSASALLTFWSR